MRCDMADTSTAAFPGRFWSAPLVPVAAAWTGGIVFDRHFSIDPLAAASLAGLFLVLWIAFGHRSPPTKSPASMLLFLWLAVAAAGAMRPHLAIARVAADDISE